MFYRRFRSLKLGVFDTDRRLIGERDEIHVKIASRNSRSLMSILLFSRHFLRGPLSTYSYFVSFRFIFLLFFIFRICEKHRNFCRRLYRREREQRGGLSSNARLALDSSRAFFSATAEDFTSVESRVFDEARFRNCWPDACPST